MRINEDINARRSHYEHLAPNEVLVTKIFRTIQGEGPLAGEPSVFVRLAGCNLGSKDMCPWCDTYFPVKTGTAMKITDVLAEARSMVPFGHDQLMVLTGGEPLLQNPHLLIELFLSYGWKVQVETNGYFWSRELHDLVNQHRNFVVVVSPKVNFRKLYPLLPTELWHDSSCLKVVVDEDPSSPYYRPPSYAHDYVQTGKPVLVSPINHYLKTPPKDEAASMWNFTLMDYELCRRNHRYAAKIALENGWRLSLQTHLFAEQE